jgi:cellulose synthase/poly-beta-1,6-N-acetylglucosamine synthase-like glycosyltransferase
MLKKFLVIFAIFLLSFFAYLSLSNPTAMSVSQTSPNFWLPLSISIIFLFFFLILLGMNERELAEKVGILKKIREKEAKRKSKRSAQSV